MVVRGAGGEGIHGGGRVVERAAGLVEVTPADTRGNGPDRVEGPLAAGRPDQRGHDPGRRIVQDDAERGEVDRDAGQRRAERDQGARLRLQRLRVARRELEQRAAECEGKRMSYTGSHAQEAPGRFVSNE